MCVTQSSFDLTNQEYIELLSGEVDNLSSIIDEIKYSKKINKVDFDRLKILNDINNQLKISVKNYKELLNFFNDIEIEKRKSILLDFNDLLIDIVKKIQGKIERINSFLIKQYALDEIEKAPGRPRSSTYDSTGTLKGRKICLT